MKQNFKIGKHLLTNKDSGRKELIMRNNQSAMGGTLLLFEHFVGLDHCSTNKNYNKFNNKMQLRTNCGLFFPKSLQNIA
jgi:hypothetical protein